MLRDTTKGIIYVELPEELDGGRWQGPFMARLVDGKIELLRLPRGEPFYVIPDELPE